MEDRGADVAGGLGQRGIVVADGGTRQIFLRPVGLQGVLLHQAARDTDGICSDPPVFVGREIIGSDDRLGDGIGRAQPDGSARGRLQVAGAHRYGGKAMQGIAELVERQRLHVELDVRPFVVGRGLGEDAELRGRHGERALLEQGIFRAHQRPADQRMVGLVQRLDAMHLEDRALLKVILQVAADARLVVHDGDAQLAEPVGRTDAGELQDLRRADRTGRQDDLAPGPRLEEPAVLPELDADGALAVEDHLLDQHSGLQAQVGAVEHGLQEGAGRGPAHTALLVDVEIADPGIVAGVEIRRHRNAHLRRRPGDGIQDIPLHARLLDPPFAAGAVMLGVAEEMIVETLEDGADVVPAPAGEPELAPVVVVLGLAAHRDHGVDRRAAADHLAARVFQAAPVQAGLLLGLEHPVRPRIADGKQVAHRNVEPDPVVAAARFQEQHA